MMDFTFRIFSKQKEPVIRKNSISLLIILLALFIFLIPSKSSAQCSGQVSINLESLYAPANLWRIEDILNIEIINNTADQLETYVVVNIYEENIGELFIITSSSFILEPEYRGFISPSELEPIHVEDRNSEYSDFMKEVALTTGSLPAGNYEICVYALEPGTELCYGKSCIHQAIAHPSPPELIYPVNESFVIEDLPIFSWIPPMPSFGEVKYTIEIVEILDGQNPIEAIDANFRWFVKTDIEVTSIQYPVADREFTYGARYAWRVGAVIGPESNVNPIVMSPVWSFVFQGSEEYVFNENYVINLLSPGKDDIVKDLPFFEWELTNPSAQTAEKRVFDEGIYYNLKIWQWPDSLGAGEADLYKSNLGGNPQIAPYLELNKLRNPYVNISEITADTLKDNYTYLWKVSSIKNEIVIAESEVHTFSILRDTDFVEASESMLRTIELGDKSEVYGIIEPIPAGAVIESEEPSDIDSILVMSTSYLFIIDDEPNSRFGHPVRYVLVDKEDKSVDVYDANWFPTLINADDTWKSSGTTKIEDTDITLLKSRGKTERRPRDRSITNENVAEALLSIACKNFALFIDGGDKDRTGATNNIASNAARQTDSMQAIYEKKRFNILRLSQYWDYKNDSVKAVLIDPQEKKGAISLTDILLQLKNRYITKGCCANSNLDFELFIYINANAMPNSSKFKMYTADGSGIHENIDYFKDILKPLQTLPQCVKITLFIDACFSGSIINPQLLDAYLKRGNFEIITATNAEKTTFSGVVKGALAAKNDEIDQLARDIENNSPRRTVKNRNLLIERSFTEEVELAINNLNSGSGAQQTDYSDFDEIFTETQASMKKSSEAQGREFQRPQYARLGQRYEDLINFPIPDKQSKIKGLSVSPKNAANIILDEKNGNVIVFAKIKGEIKVTVTFEDGTQEVRSVRSKWGDDT